MTAEIFFCSLCAKYTLQNPCASCAGKTFSPRPPRYSPLDKWGKWRRLAKKELESKEVVA